MNWFHFAILNFRYRPQDLFTRFGTFAGNYSISIGPLHLTTRDNNQDKILEIGFSTQFCSILRVMDRTTRYITISIILWICFFGLLCIGTIQEIWESHPSAPLSKVLTKFAIYFLQCLQYTGSEIMNQAWCFKQSDEQKDNLKVSTPMTVN